MNPQMQTEAQHDRAIYSQVAPSETDVLAGWGFTQQEITLLRLPTAVVPDGWERPRKPRALPGISPTVGQEW